MTDPNDPYLNALPPVPVLTLPTTLDIKSDGYYERPIIATSVIPHMGSDGTLHCTNSDHNHIPRRRTDIITEIACSLLNL